MSRAFTTVGDGTSKCQFRLHLLRKGVDDDFVGIDNSFLDEGVVYSLADKEFLVCNKRLKRGKSGGVIGNRRKRPFVERVMVTIIRWGGFHLCNILLLSHSHDHILTKLIGCVPNPSNIVSRIRCHPQRWLRRTRQIRVQ